MTATVTTNVTELPESRARVEVEVAPAEIERRMQQTARKLGNQLRIPGFRKGKVPPPVVIRRLGRDVRARRGDARLARRLVHRCD